MIRRAPRMLAVAALVAGALLGAPLGSVPVVRAADCPRDDPRAFDDAYSVDMNGALSVLDPGVLRNDDPCDGYSTTVSWDSTPSTGTFAPALAGGFTYVPQANAWGTEHATYHFVNSSANDTEYSNVASVTITIKRPPNQPPTSTGTCGPFSFPENAGPKALACLTWTDAEGEFLTGHVVVETTDNPMLLAAGPLYKLTDSVTGEWAGSLTLTSAPDESGWASLLIWVTDSGGTDNGGNDTSVKTTVKVTIVAPAPTGTAPASKSSAPVTPRPSIRPGGSSNVAPTATTGPTDSGQASGSPLQSVASPLDLVAPAGTSGPASVTSGLDGSGPPWITIAALLVALVVGSNLGLFLFLRSRRNGA
jgi:hypothetical protein